MALAPPLRPFTAPRAALVATHGADAFARLPYCCRILAENLLRTLAANDRAPLLDALLQRRHDVVFPFRPARVMLELDGAPALIDLAGLQRASAARRDPPNPRFASRQGQVASATPRHALDLLDALMPGRGIVRRLDLAAASPVIGTEQGIPFPDTVISDSPHAAALAALGVLGWRAGVHDTQTLLRGQPLPLRLPSIIGLELVGVRQPACSATALAHALAAFLRRHAVDGAIVECRGPGVATLSMSERAAIATQAPAAGARCALFAIDATTLDFLQRSARAPAAVRLVDAYSRSQGLTPDALDRADYDRRLVFDLAAPAATASTMARASVGGLS